MRLIARKTLGLSAAVVLAGAALSIPTSSANAADESAAIQPFLASQLKTTSSIVPTTVLVHGSSLKAANGAVQAAGLRKVSSFDKIGVVVATGTKGQIEKARTQPGVTYLEGNAPLEFTQSTSNKATRGAEAAATLLGADGTALTGKGVSVGVIDTGVDPTHPYFKGADGKSAVVSNQKVVCDPIMEATCEVVKVPNDTDTDSGSAGGHGTHVSGIVAGRPTTLTTGEKLQGAAPGAKLVSISTGAGLVILGADTALNWVLENHAAPCGVGVSTAECPPIRVTNNSYGPSGGGSFDPNSATVKLQRQLAAQGVLTVWANGNDGGDGSTNLSNPPGMDPTGGVISVASYSDLETGTRDGVVSDYSSRGLAGNLATYPDISAPGDTITSSCRPYLAICSTGGDPKNGPGAQDIGTFNTISGTSMAAPHIAGIVAQLVQANPNATPAQIENAIKSTAYKFSFGAPYQAGPLGTTSFDKGYGLVDVVAAVNALR